VVGSEAVRGFPVAGSGENAASHAACVVNANTGEEQGATVVRVPQTTNRDNAAAVVTARCETGDVIIDDLR
jgi:hypothetical protein